jgi:hypothetical protein
MPPDAYTGKHFNLQKAVETRIHGINTDKTKRIRLKSFTVRVVAFCMYHADLSVFIRVHPWLTAVFRFKCRPVRCYVTCSLTLCIKLASFASSDRATAVISGL